MTLLCVMAAAAPLVLGHGGNMAAASSVLRPAALQRLNTGQTRPAGWMLDELTLQAKGISGQLPYFWHYLNCSAWMGCAKDKHGREGGSPTQFLPYYLNGLVPLSYQVNDTNLAELRDKHMTSILASQTVTGSPPAGWLGPAVETPLDYWPKYLAIEAIESYAEAIPAAESAKVVSALVSHHRQMWKAVSTRSPAFNQSKWGFARYSDAIVGIQWLLDRGEGTGDSAFLVDLMRFIRTTSDDVMASVSPADGGGYDWEEWFRSGDPFTNANDGEKTRSVHLRRHGVDIGQAMKTGALWWRVDGNETDRQNPYTALQWGEKYLHMSDGMYFADEEVSYGGGNTSKNGGHTAGRGTETCSIVETMFSMREAYEITGNITFMDRLERLAFNSLPAAVWEDWTANVYHHSSNQLSCGGQYGYNLFYCCTANVHQGLPKFVLSAVHFAVGATQTGTTTVISGYTPSVSQTSEGNTITIGGGYPFSDSALITVSAAASLALRVPCWSSGASIAVAGVKGPTATATAAATPCAFYNLTVPAGATVNITFATDFKIYRWQANQTDGSYDVACGGRTGSPCGPHGGGVEVHRGPLTFALRPRSTVVETPLGCAGGQAAGRYSWNCSGSPIGFPAIKGRNVAVATDGTGNWSYGIVVESLEFVGGGQIPAVPWSSTAPPAVKVVAKARNLNYFSAGAGPVWAEVGRPPASPLSSEAPLETIELVPFGATNIRVSVFPELKR